MFQINLHIGLIGLLDEWPNLADYVVRGEARPSYRRAFAAQRDVNKPVEG